MDDVVIHSFGRRVRSRDSGRFGRSIHGHLPVLRRRVLLRLLSFSSLSGLEYSFLLTYRLPTPVSVIFFYSRFMLLEAWEVLGGRVRGYIWLFGRPQPLLARKPGVEITHIQLFRWPFTHQDVRTLINVLADINVSMLQSF